MLGNWRHVCVDMQRMFAEDTPWKVSWMQEVAPEITEVCSRFRERTIFTRFCPPRTSSDATGMWRAYYEKWWMMTREHLPVELLDIVPALARYVPPAKVFDKGTYSPWIDGRLHTILASEAVSTIVISGGETDVCVLGTALGGVDLGYRIIVLSDAVCSAANDTHDASLSILGGRFSAQIEVMTTAAFLRSDPPT
jgi:nicotinamidase-related amidase